MSLHRPPIHVLLSRHAAGFHSAVMVCAVLTLSSAAGTVPGNDGEGPTLALSYSQATHEENTIASFMYFVPLLSRTVVERQTSTENEQVVRFVSYQKQVNARTFRVACEFEMRGSGYHKNTFESVGMIAGRIREIKEKEPLTALLDYIRFEGEGFGRIEVEGTVDKSGHFVTEVHLRFNTRSHKSPVTIGLYDVKPVDGEYTYENRSNELVARVNTLTFRRTDSNPRMGVTVASIAKKTAVDGFLARVKGPIASLLIKPPKIDALGNEAMLNFGDAIFRQAPEFTFPLAKNIKEHRTIAALRTP